MSSCMYCKRPITAHKDARQCPLFNSLGVAVGYAPTSYRECAHTVSVQKRNSRNGSAEIRCMACGQVTKIEKEKKREV